MSQDDDCRSRHAEDRAGAWLWITGSMQAPYEKFSARLQVQARNRPVMMMNPSSSVDFEWTTSQIGPDVALCNIDTIL
eukprot:1424966-Rhodomonas_salina.3